MTQQIFTPNPYINQLQQFLQAAHGKTADWLVLAHNDVHLLNHLEEAFPDSLLAVISQPQSCWQMSEPLIAEAIGWALCESGVKGVLLIGHSQGGLPEEHVKLIGGKHRPAAGNNGQAGSSSSPLDRLRQAQARASSVQNHFEKQMDILSRIPALETRLARQQTQLHGLFYRAESGVFFAYDWQERAYRALLQKAMAA